MATDTNIPPQTLTFSLAPGVPGGASLNATNGLFSWTAPQTNSLVTNSVTVRVADNGSPPLTNSASFKIVVVPPPQISAITAHGDNVMMTWQTYPGKTYRVQFKNDLTETNWRTLGSDTVADGAGLSITNSTGASPQRFYRILRLD